MRRLICIAASILALIGPAGAARAAGERFAISLREKAVVEGPVVALCDVADLGEGMPDKVAHLSVGNSPWPGHLRDVTRVLVKVRLLSAGFDLQRFEFGGSDVCVVEAASACIPAERLVAAAREHLLAQFPPEGPRVEIELLRAAPAVLVAAGEAPVELRPRLYGTDPPAGTVRVDVDVVRAGERLRRVPLSFSVKLRERVAVALRPIGQGRPFRAADVSFVERDVAAASRPCVRLPEELEGKVAMRSIRPGQIIARQFVGDPEAPVVIDYNQRVFLVVETDTLRAVTVGKALCRARKGEIARARNLSSGREVVGLATEDSTIRVLLKGHENEG
ncbi:MAG: hypothetical protein AMK73_04725 [Planctomycetes bacterium SM23_32]|nr:MAG: hypothetical protein AMK73_04725 [Planctomycetes bacterium SM23_32]